jgi:hypothetical protein
LGDSEVFADTPEQVQSLMESAKKSEQPQEMDIGQSELDALMASMGDDEVFSDEPPVKKEAPAAPKAEKVLSQEEIDALLSSMGG